LRGDEVFDVQGLDDGRARVAEVSANRADGTRIAFKVQVLLLTPKEVEYYRHGGLLHYVLRQLAQQN
jgi:aconitate hydratase